MAEFGSGSQTTRDNGDNGNMGEAPSMASILMAMERGRQQAEENQARMMATHANFFGTRIGKSDSETIVESI